MTETLPQTPDITPASDKTTKSQSFSGSDSGISKPLYLSFIGRPYLLGSIALVVVVGVTLLLLYLDSLTQHHLPAPNQTSPPQYSSTSKAYPTPNAFQKGPFRCPSVLSFCQTGKAVYVANIYVGLGSKLPSHSPIYAVFDGNLTVVKSSDGSAPDGTSSPLYVSLTNVSNQMHAIYHFLGDVPKNGAVKRGDIISYVSASQMPLYSGDSLVFGLTRFDPLLSDDRGGEIIPLTAQDFTDQ